VDQLDLIADSNRSLRFFYPHLPPSENRIRVMRYAGGRAKGMCYSKEAEDYRKVFLDIMRQEHGVAIQKFVQGHRDQSLYRLKIVFWFPEEELLNKGWPKKQAKTLYKKVDAGNRRKLLEDCLAEALGIDDSLFFSVHLEKRIGDPLVGISLIEDEPRVFGVKSEWLI
jgi:hypothetical protein